MVPGSAASSLPAPGSRPAALSCLPGAPLVHREPADAALAPDTSPDRITKAVFAAVYTVLQVGWQQGRKVVEVVLQVG